MDRSTDDVALRVATAGDGPVLANLLELYVHELSDVFPGLQVGPDGRFGYPKLPLYFETAAAPAVATRFPFLIVHAGHLAGFALITRGSPASDDPDVFDVAEFFVLRAHRGAGVGRRAAEALWGRFPGPWTVRVAEGNRNALAFWSSTVAAYAGGAAVQARRAGHGGALWRVYSFRSDAGARPP